MSNLTLYRKGSLFDEMDRFVDGMFNNTTAHTPAVDVTEDDEQYELIAELPGMEQKDVDVRVNDGLLTIEAKQEAKSQQEEGRYLLRERRNVYSSRSFRLPGNVDQEKIKADFANGLLNLKIPKVEKARPRSIKIN